MEEPVEEFIFNEAAGAGGEEAEAPASRPPGRIRKAYRARVAKPLKVERGAESWRLYPCRAFVLSPCNKKGRPGSCHRGAHGPRGYPVCLDHHAGRAGGVALDKWGGHESWSIARTLAEERVRAEARQTWTAASGHASAEAAAEAAVTAWAATEGIVQLDAWCAAQVALGRQAVVQRVCTRKPWTATAPRVRHRDGLTHRAEAAAEAAAAAAAGEEGGGEDEAEAEAEAEARPDAPPAVEAEELF